MDTKFAPIDLGAFLDQPGNLAVFGLIAVFLFAVLLRAHRETALVAIIAGVIGFWMTA